MYTALIVNKCKKNTKSVLFGPNKFNRNITCPHLKIAGDEIQFVNDYKYLGIILDKHLSFSKHIKYVHSLAAHKIYMLSKRRSCTCMSTAIQMYKLKCYHTLIKVIYSL